MPLSILDAQDLRLLHAPTDHGAETFQTSSVHLVGYDGVAFIIAATIDDDIDIKVLFSDDNVSFEDVPNALTVTSNVDGKIRVIDVAQSPKNYLKVEITTVGSTNIISVVALLYDVTGREPITISTDIDQLVKVMAS